MDTEKESKVDGLATGVERATLEIWAEEIEVAIDEVKFGQSGRAKRSEVERRVRRIWHCHQRQV